MKEFNLENKIALVTGGGTGIGLAIATCLVEAGARVIITGRREEKLKEAVALLGEKAEYRVNDLSNLAEIPLLVKNLIKNYKKIDILINNAGINLKKPALELSDEEFNQIIQTNLTAVFSLSREVGKEMVGRGEGSIIMISSMAAYYGIDRVAAYASAKSGVYGMVRVLASEWSAGGVRVNAIAPGFIETDMSKRAMESDPERKNRAVGRTPMGYFGKPRDIGYAAVFLASDAAKYITGISLPVDGGNSIGF